MTKSLTSHPSEFCPLEKVQRARGSNLCFLSLGSNLGDKEENLRRAVEGLSKEVGTVEKVSSFFYSEPWGFESENGFVNVCVKISTRLTPRELLSATQKIEREMGRTEKSLDGVYHDRVIDIDIIMYGNETVDEPDLQIPHPLWKEREFVTVPLKEIL